MSISYSHFYEQTSGFTLLEMLLVVSILAILGAVLMHTMRTGVKVDQQQQIARFEMEQIRRALLRYRADVGGLTSGLMNSPADFGFLFDTTNTWDPDYQTGLRGPYISGGDTGLVDIGDDLGLDGSGAPQVVVNAAHTGERGIPDPFVLAAVENNNPRPLLKEPCIETAANNLCVLDWRFVGQGDTDAPHARFGRPYLLFDIGTAHARIVSMGPNGVYENDESLTCPPNPNGDDLVLCLY